MTSDSSKFIRNLLAAVIATSLTACGSSDSNKSPEFLSNYAFEQAEETPFSASVTATDENTNDSLKYTVLSAASSGVFQLESNGSFVYTPNIDFVGEDLVTVQVSDGTDTASTIVTFTVTNVNDAPVLQASSIVVSSQGESIGTLDVSDSDGDAITFSVVTEPALGTLTLNDTTGEFSYTPASLQQIDQSFTVSYTDGNIGVPIEAKIDLQSAFISNADKLNYYYSSEKSHLKSAEALLDYSNDQEAQDSVVAEIAKGYYIAGFEQKGAELLSSIIQNDVKGKALRLVAIALDSANKTELANQLRTAAESAFNQYIAEKGLSSISSKDASFYQSLMNDYLDAGESELAENLLTTINIFANVIKEDEYSTAYGRFVTAAFFQVGDRVEKYLETFKESDRKKAEFAIDNMASLSEGIGYKASGGFPAYRTRSFFLSYAADYYYIIKSFDKSKEYTAKTLSYFTEVNYDPDYTYEADAYAEATYNSSLSPVETVAGLLAGLYPELAVNPALAIIEPDDNDYEDAQEEIFAYQVVNNLLAGETVAEASQAAYDYFVTEKDDIRTFYEILVDENLGERSGKTAIKLIVLQEKDLAIDVLKYAFDNVLNTQKYIEDTSGNRLDRYITGDWGCHRVITLLDSLEEDVSTYQAECQTISDTYLTTEAGLVSTSVAQEVYKNLISSYAITNNTDAMTLVAATSREEAALMTDAPLEQLVSYLEIASALASYGVIVEAGDYLAMAITSSNNLLSGEITEDLLDDLIGEFGTYAVAGDNEISNSSGYTIYTLESALRRQAGKNVNYTIEMAEQLNALQATIKLLTKKSFSLSVNEQQGLMEDLIELNANAGLYDEATELVNNEVNEAADIIEYVATLTEIIATQDDFPASEIALIDTDTDGMPNFFLLSATDEQILASGLTSDTDSDGDDITDEADTMPLTGE